MKTFGQFLTEAESPAAKQAKQMGLVSDGFGRWKNPKTGDITHRSEGDRLVEIQPGELAGDKSGGGAGEPQGAPDQPQQVDLNDPIQAELYKNFQIAFSLNKYNSGMDAAQKKRVDNLALAALQKKLGDEFAASQAAVPAEEPEPEVDPAQAEIEKMEMDNRKLELQNQKKELQLQKKELDVASRGEAPIDKMQNRKKREKEANRQAAKERSADRRAEKGEPAKKPKVEEKPKEDPKAKKPAPKASKALDKTATKAKKAAPKKQEEVVERDEDDVTSEYLQQFDEVTGEYRKKLGNLTKRQNANVDKKFKKLREAFSNIKSGSKKKAFVNALSLAYGYSGRVNSGAGKNALGQVDLELLEANKDRLMDGYGDGSPETIKEFVEGTRVVDVTDDEVEAFFDSLPDKLQKNFMKAGKISDAYAHHSLGIDKDGNQMRGKLSGKTNGVANGRLRGLMVAKLFLQQGGKDGYSGADLDLDKTDLEHVRGFNNLDDGAPTQEMKDQRENVDNFILTASNLNQTKVDKSMENWYDTEINKLKSFTDEDFQKRDELTEQSNTINDKAKLLTQLFLEGDQLSGNASSKLFDVYAENDRNVTKLINKNINQFGKTKGVKLPNVKNRLGYEMIKNLGLGAYMLKKSGRGNQAKLDDKIYTAFVSTMMDQDAEGRERLSKVWKEARELGSKAAQSENNDGAAKRELINYVKENGGFADRFLNSKEFRRILSEALETMKSFFKILNE